MGVSLSGTYGLFLSVVQVDLCLSKSNGNVFERDV